MPTIYDIITYLKDTDELEIVWHGKEECLYNKVNGISTDQDAGSNELAWISSKYADIYPERIENFLGTLLIGPHNLCANNVSVISCNNPKLAFILTIRRFFSELAMISWPTNGRQIAEGSVVAENVTIPSGVVIGSNTLIEPNVVIGPNTTITNCTIKKGVHIGANCSIGLPGFGYERDANGKYWRFPHIGGVIIEEDVEIGSNTCIDRGSIGNTILHHGAKIDNLVHIAHNVEIGSNSVVIANCMIGGSVKIESNTWVAPSVSIMNQVNIGSDSLLGLGSVVLKDVGEKQVVVGNPAKILRQL